MMYVGLDVSKNEIVCVGMDKKGNVLYENKWSTSKEGLDAIIANVGKRSMLAVEPSTKGIFVYDYLASKNMNVVLANAGKIRLIADSEVKTDRNDATIIADTLRGGRMPTCHRASKEAEENRDLVRHRRSMVTTRAKIKSKMRAILAREGIDIDCADILGNEAMSELENVELKSEVQKEALDRYLRLAGILTSEIDDYNAKILEKYKSSKEAQLLDTIPGVDYYAAVHMMSAIDNIGRFPSDEELASYASLTPRIYQSGDKRWDRGLKHGDKLLNWILIQCTHAAIRKTGENKLRKYYLRKLRRKGKQKAIVATARKMVEIIYVMLTRGEPYSENYGK